MIISHRDRWIFVRTRKTAGTSIEVALSAIAGADAVITTMSPRDERIRVEWGGRPPQNHLAPGVGAGDDPVPPGPGPGIRFYNHMPADRIRDEVGRSVWSRYFTFCFERNPWDKVVSLYYHRHRQDPRPAIIDFIRSGEAADCLNWPLYGGSAPVDFVGRYENLAEDLSAVATRNRLGALPALPRAKGQFRPGGTDYRTVLGDRERGLVAELFAPEISRHGYTW